MGREEGGTASHFASLQLAGGATEFAPGRSSSRAKARTPRPWHAEPSHLEGGGGGLQPAQVARFVLAALPGTQPLLAGAEPVGYHPLNLVSDTVRHVLAGTVARTCAQAFIHPIDTVKTRLQVSKSSAPELLRTWRAGSKQQPIDLQWRGHQITLRNFLLRGPRDIYLGLTGAVLGTLPTALLYFATYEAVKDRLEARGAGQAVTHLTSASAGAVVSAFVRVPSDTLKHRVQAYLFPDVWVGARTVLASSGLGGLYSGLWPTLLRDVPEIAIQFALYESLRRAAARRRGTPKLRTWEHLVLGGASGGVAACVTMPLDFCKTVLQCGSQKSVRAICAATLRDKGPQGLFAGMGPRVTQTAIMSGVFFTLFEFWKAQLKGAAQRAEDDRFLRPKIWRKRRERVWKRQFAYR